MPTVTTTIRFGIGGISTIDKEKQRHRIGMEKTQFAYDMMMYYKSTESFHQCSPVRK